jgi:hypothetical protein
MTMLHDDVYDNGLAPLETIIENLYLCNADPELTWANIASYAIGSKASPTISAPQDRDGGDGREVVVDAIVDGTASATDTATHFALTDDSETKILVSGPTDSDINLTDGFSFTTSEFAIGIPGPVVV